MAQSKEFEQIKAGGCLLLLGWFFFIVMGHMLGCNGSSRTPTPAVHSMAYDAGYDAGYACCKARQNSMSYAVLKNVARARFPTNPEDFETGYRSGYMAAP